MQIENYLIGYLQNNVLIAQVGHILTEKLLLCVMGSITRWDYFLPQNPALHNFALRKLASGEEIPSMCFALFFSFQQGKF